MKLSFDKTFLLGLVLAALCLAGLTVTVYLTANQLRESLDLAQGSQDLLVTLERISTGLVDLETGQRGYLLTGDEQYLKPYLAASGRLDEELATLTVAAAGNRLDPDRLATLRRLIAEERDELARTIDLRRTQGLAAAMDVVRSGDGQRTMESIRGALGEMAQRQSRLLDTRKDEERRGAQAYAWAASGTLLLAALLLTLIYMLMRRELRARVRAEKAQEDAYAQLRVRVEERTQALRESDTALGQSRQDLGAAVTALRRSKALLSGVIETATDAIVVVDQTQHILLANPSAEAMFRCQPKEMLGAPLERFIPARFRAAHAMHIESFGATGATKRRMGGQSVLFGLRADKEEFPIEASISQLLEDGDHLYTVILRDVTERQRLQDALERSHSELRDLSSALQSIREEERKRVARELHDDLGQSLAALRMDLAILKGGLASVDGGLAHLVERMDQLLVSTVGSVRRIAADLRPKVLDELGLYPALQTLVGDFSERHRIGCELSASEDELPLDDTFATSLFRMTQEALNNVAKHAQATAVAIHIETDAEGLVLTVRDNGKGMPTDGSRKPKSFGLIGMRERAYILGGNLAVVSQPGAGTTVRISLPLSSGSHRHHT
jgi:PAS domain S-box-containing protein